MERMLDNKYTLGCALVLEKYKIKCDAATEFREKKRRNREGYCKATYFNSFKKRLL